MGGKHSTLITQIPMNAGLSKPPLQLDPIHHSAKPMKLDAMKMVDNTGPLSSLNFAERANRPHLDPINLSSKKMSGRGISSTSRSGFKDDDHD